MSTGNVGIGTASPGAKVDILGLDLNIGADYGAPTTRTNSTVKVGVITSPHYTTAEENFTGMLLVGNSTANEVVLGGGTSTYNSATQIKFYTGANSTTVLGTERMRIDSSGNVGIANSNPSGNAVGENGKSLIVGNESAANESASISIISGSNGYSYLLFGDGDGASGYQGQVRYQHSSNNLQFVTGANERMRIDSSGNVIIGDTTGTSPNSADRFLKIGKSNLQDCSIILQDLSLIHI